MTTTTITQSVENHETGEQMTVEIIWDRHGFQLHFAGFHVGTFDVDRHPRFHSANGFLTLDKEISE